MEKTAMAIFKNWFIDFEPFKDDEFVYNEELGREIPKGWEVKRLGDVAEVIMGQSPPSKFYNEEGIGIPFIQGIGQFGKYTPQTLVFCSCKGKLARLHDILITVRAPVGELNLADGEYIIGRGVASLRTDYWSFLFIYFSFNKELLKSLEKGTTYDAIVKDDLEGFSILLPPPHILQSFHSLVEPLFQKIILNQKQIMTLRKVRDTLLPLLVFGKLRVEEM
ncbi:restriction endonuclease subunit S [Thermodesulfobacterium sp. TA1]|nr:restriction endonuclease subunit S [Thermodesulfobacterium sp. TA1]QER41218.1 restriction endonuclease subunit S [Thermodesulfobacterium sp. TA1]